MAKQGHTDSDMGLEAIFKETQKLKSMCVKVGVTEDVARKNHEDGEATYGEIAVWNELGVLGPPISENGDGKWFIPPRPFVRGFADGKRELIKKTMEKLGGLVSGGKMKAETAIESLGETVESGIRSYIQNGPHTANATSTIAKKGSSKPLINNGMRGGLKANIRHQVIEKPIGTVSEE